MIKFIKILQLAQQAHLQSIEHNKALKLFAWFQGNSFSLSEDEFNTVWKLLLKVFDDVFGSCEKFDVPDESKLEMFDSRADHREIGIFLSALEIKLDKLKVFL